MSDDWIRTLDALPHFDVEVLVYLPGGEPDMAVACYRESINDDPYWDYADETLSNITIDIDPEPTHWRLKPSPPQPSE